MGGRGSVSVSGGKVGKGELNGGKNDIKNIGGDSDARSDIQKMFVDELGFSDVKGLKGIDTAILGAQGIALNNLERKYGALAAVGVGSMEVLGMDSASAIAAVRSNALTGQPNALMLNRRNFSEISSMTAYQREAEKARWSMPTDSSTISLARYTATHEYGHIVESALYMRDRAAQGGNLHEGVHAAQVKRDILSIAKGYGGSATDVSRYGNYDSYEFFAEAFANANSGRPNAIGRAMNDYLRQHKL